MFQVATEGSFDPNAGSNARCTIKSVNNNFVNQNYTGTGYDCMKNISATVINSTHLTCRTIATQNGSPALVSVSMDNGITFSNTTAIEVVPAFEWLNAQCSFQ